MPNHFLYRTITAAATTAILSLSPNAYSDGFDLSEKLSVTGFIDMSTVRVEPDGGDSSTDSGFDQFEIDLLFDFGSGLSAQVDLEYQDDGDGEEFDVEQAFFTYGVNDALSFKA
ncbi:MAG: porin, partial [Gammaproteobacteria bacterium]|nr:porin [Gammaproteobacteria bacterium]